VALPGADLTTHHSEGIAVHGDTPFRVDLISHIDGNLWSGGCINGVRLPDDFAFVVSLYPRERYEIGPDTTRVECKLYDSNEIPDERRLLDLARMVNAFCAVGKTLVHCQAGLNRSGLVAGLALVLAGRTPEQAVTLLRERRCDAVLCNSHFAAWLAARRPSGEAS
jgi:protein-tyrosine phosphatase